MGKTHYAVVKDNEGNAIQQPLKQWVRQNIKLFPPDIYDDKTTSHMLRSRLMKLGWRMQENENEVFIIEPDEDGIEYSNSLIDQIKDDKKESEVILEEAQEISFSLEKDLQKALRVNIASLEEGLTIIDNGRERNTIAGRIDITAKDTFNRIVVIELKAIEAKPDVIAQILSYMEAIKTEDQTDVRGIIIASGFSERVKLAAKQINNLKLVTYSFQFNFNVLN